MLVDTNKYRVKADQLDWRDIPYVSTNKPLRKEVDLRHWSGPIENQLHLGSCTSNAIAGAYELLINKETPKDFTNLSRLFVYYNGRLLENVVKEDVGIYMRDGIKSVKQYGICSESIWPYNISKFAMVPTLASYNDAKHRNIKNYFRIKFFEDILDALNNDIPVTFSMLTYHSFETDSFFNNVIKMPAKDESPIGGHAMFFVGYDLAKEILITQNSFGKFWGDGGYCYMPFAYAKAEIMDTWVFDIEIT